MHLPLKFLGVKTWDKEALQWDTKRPRPTPGQGGIPDPSCLAGGWGETKLLRRN